jgi:HSP20 family protein
LAERQSDRRWAMQGYMIFRPTARFTPPTDVIEFENRLVVMMEIAGMKTSDFNISLMNNHLVISGTRERPVLQGAAYHQVEIGYGDFRVELVLPWSVDQDEVSANYRDGFLHVELPRKPEKPIRVIDVSAAEEDTDER